MLAPKLGAPLALDVPEDVEDFRVGGVSALGQTDDAGAAFLGRIASGEIPETFEAPKKLVHGLLAHAGPLGQHAWSNAVGARELQYRHGWHTQPVETCGVESVDDPTGNGLGRNPQKGADEHLFDGDRWR